MLSLYEILKTARTGITPSLWNMAAARAFFGETFERTDENDYVYNDHTIIYYKGGKLRPKVPETLGNNAMTEIAAEAFSGSPVNAVKLPEGMEVIR